MKRISIALSLVIFFSCYCYADLRIMSYNIKDFWLRFDGQSGVITQEGGVIANKDMEKLNVISSLILSKQPDVIAILECASLGELLFFNERFLNDKYQCWSFRAVDSRTYGIPLGIMVSKELQVHSIELVEPRSFSQRGIIIADISKDNYRLTLIAVHLKAKIEEVPGESAVKRHEQCERLREIIKEKLEQNPDSNIIICGDFNDPPGRDEQEVAAEVDDLMEEMVEPIVLSSGLTVEIHNATLEHKDLDQNEALWTEKSKSHDPILFDYFFLSRGAWNEFETLDHVYPEEFINIMEASDHIPIMLDLKKE